MTLPRCCLHLWSLAFVVGVQVGNEVHPWQWHHSWQSVKPSRSEPPLNSKFTLKGLIRAKDNDRKCKWLEDVKKSRDDNWVVGVNIDQTYSKKLILALGSLALPAKHKKGKQEIMNSMMKDYDCIVSELERVAGATRFIVSLRDPVSQIMSGIGAHLNAKEPTHPKNKKYGRKAFIHNFKSPDSYIDALRDVDNAHHKIAMRLTYAHDIQNYMIPLRGFYLRDGNEADVKFVCACELTKLSDMLKVAIGKWGLTDKHSPKATSRRNNNMTHSQNFSEPNRKWIEHIYAADLALYKENCAHC